MSKKILSAAIAVVMVLSVFSLTAFAYTKPASGEVGILVESDAVPGQKDGVANVSVYWVFPDDTDFSTYLATIGNICLGINSAKYSYVADSREWQSEMGEYSLVKADDSYVRVAHKDVAGVMKTVYSKLTENDKKYGYDTSVLLQMTFDGGNSYGTTAAKGWHVTPDSENKVLVATLQFNVLDELTENDAIGIVEATLNNQTLVNYSNGTKQQKGTAMKSGDGIPAAGYKVFDGAVKIRKNAADNTKYDLGFTGSFEDFDPEFAESGTSATIKSVGCEVTINGVTNTYTDRYVYEGTTYGKYAFRVAVGAFGPYDTNEVSIRMFVELNEAVDGQTKFYSEGITTTMNEQIQARDS